MKPGDHPEFFRFPAPEGTSRESTIRLDREGQFWHNGERLEHPKLAEAFHTWLRRHPDDRRYILTNGYDWTYVTVDDAPFTVRAVHHDDGHVTLVLSNGDTVQLTALRQADDGSLYAPVRVHDDDFEARFSRQAQVELEPALVERDGQIGVMANGIWLVPEPRTAAAAPGLSLDKGWRWTPTRRTHGADPTRRTHGADPTRRAPDPTRRTHGADPTPQPPPPAPQGEGELQG